MSQDIKARELVLMTRLLQFYTLPEAVKWLASVHPQLKVGRSALDEIENGNIELVEAILDRLESDAYL